MPPIQMKFGAPMQNYMLMTTGRSKSKPEAIFHMDSICFYKTLKMFVQQWKSVK